MSDRVKYTDDLLDEKFAGVERQLADLRTLPANFGKLATAVDGLTKEVSQLRTDAHEDIGILREDTRQVSRVLLGFLTALLVAMVAAIIGVIIIL